MPNRRIPGGEKNENSGKRWTKEELSEVLNLFISEDGIKIHEHNPKLKSLALKLNRTTRSIEAQLLMFRNLNRFGYYGYGNMNKLCKELWIEYINKSL